MEAVRRRGLSDVARAVGAAKEKTGERSGATVRHPLTGEELPLFVADYVLPGHGTGAVMAVPAHDQVTALSLSNGSLSPTALSNGCL